MASARRKVKYPWSGTAEGGPSKRSCPRESHAVAPSARPALGLSSESPQRLKARESDVSDSLRLPRIGNSSSCAPSSCPGVGAPPKGSLVGSTGGFLSLAGSLLRTASPSLEEMASLEEEPFILKVDAKDSSHNLTNSEFGTEAEGQNGVIEEPSKIQKRRRERHGDQGSTVIYLKAIQGILGKAMPKRKGEARAKLNTGERPAHGRGPIRNIRVSTPQKEKDPAPEVSSEEDKTVVERGSFCDRRVILDPQEKPSEEPFGDRRTVVNKSAPLLKFLDECDSHSEAQKQKEREVVLEHPSSGSDWSDVDEVSAVRFSQEEPVSLKLSAVPEPSAFTTDYVMYPPHLYSSPWCDYASCWTESPKTSSYFSVGNSSNDTSQARSSRRLLSDYSPKSTVNSQNSCRDVEVTEEGRSQNSRSFHFSRSLEDEEIKEKRIFQEEITSYPCERPASSGLPRSHRKLSLEEGFIDTHCHLDMLYSKLSFKGTFTKFRKIYSNSFPKEFQGCISDFCDPRTLTDCLWEELLKEDLVWGAFGCHPHFARYYSESQERNLLQALRHPKAVAFGEMGLDYSYKCTTPVPEQYKVFERQLQLAVSLKKPLVIHCREADEDLLDIMKKFVPSDYKIHRHCFTGSYPVIEPLLKYFPNMSVGFTAVLTYSSAWEARDALRQIPLERIIVETDAPYFLPRQVPKSLCQYAHPGLALHTVREIARVKDQTLSYTLAALRENTNRLYNL
ncbi:PREDICTED: putative deoxyribonuclease TATDN2-like [Elephantulus edwardii]|uniref:putative deoxyribonuclease TATDN2-like n=1 Tax=Elephantulus edwardii TaxID=28737 RepID=UPI0003F0891F|nr:PREDICTED: putative deoxyribonuclease TATDN2-like [Elephantulus edwardii]